MPSRLRLAGLIEGCTLLMLVCVAVPLKHIAGVPGPVSLLGPVHGLVFALYFVALIEAAVAETWPRRDVLRAALAPMIPFGTFLNDPWLRRGRAA
ncbi:MAG: DUF3817 domain-containing protein [Gemmatimonadaceae bacterium]|nr:DUF3817 domain-containing protein [Acetobacteraceae bacterium]